PRATRFAVLVDPTNPLTTSFISNVQAAGAAVGREIEVFTASSNRDINSAFARLAQKQADALLVTPGPLFNNRRMQLAMLAVRHAVPTMFSSREFAEPGVLMSYGPSITDEFRLAGTYTGRVLKGEKPADM